MDLLRGPGLLAGTTEPPATRLLTVERDGNPLRRYGHVSPHLGKVSPLDPGALGEISGLAADALSEEAPGRRTLVIGMAESALILSWSLAARLGSETELLFTTREDREVEGARAFLEPHSHGPVHALALPPGRSYGRVVIVEDELTSGATLRNLLLAIRDVAPLCRVVALSDRRPSECRNALRDELAVLGVDLSVLDLSVGAGSPPRHRPGVESGGRPRCATPSRRNPFGRNPTVFEEAADALWRRCRSLRPGTVYAVGECVDVALTVWEALPERERPHLRHVTRSPWIVDGAVVKDRLDLRAPCVPDHFLYNQDEGLSGRAAIVGEESTAPVARKLSGFLSSRGVEIATVEVARA